MRFFIILWIFIFSVQINAVDNTSDVQLNNQTKKQKDGWDYYAEGNYNLSITALEEEKRQFPTRINIYIILGWNYKALRNYKEMERISLEGYAINPGHINILRNLGESYFYQNKFNDAVKNFEKYLKIRHDWNDVNTHLIYQLLGVSYYNTGALYHADLALSTYNIAKPNTVAVLLLLADINQQLNKKEKAIGLYERVLNVDPVNAQAKEALLKLKSF